MKIRETFKVVENPWYALSRGLVDVFGRPWLAMLAWGAFVHMSAHHIPVDLPFLSYWEMFMLNLVCVLLTSSQISQWVVKVPFRNRTLAALDDIISGHKRRKEGLG